MFYYTTVFRSAKMYVICVRFNVDFAGSDVLIDSASSLKVHLLLSVKMIKHIFLENLCMTST